MIRKLTIFLVLLTLVPGNQLVVSIDGLNYNENEFFEFYPKTEWERINSDQKQRILKDFIRKKVAVVAAKEENFFNNPRTAIKLRNRFDFLYVNKTYEKLVALPLVPKEYIEEGKKHILRDLNISHILIGFIGSEMPGNFTRTDQEAYEEASEILTLISDSLTFESLALTKSDDPGVKSNKGNLGWVSWGKMDPEFQKELFQLKKGDVSNPIKTKYGYHIVSVFDEKDSEAVNFPEEKLIEKVEYSSLGLIKNKLRSAADSYDKELLSKINFRLNEDVIARLSQILNEHKSKMTYMNNVDIIPVLKEYEKDDILVVYNNKGYGIKWLINKISKSSPSRRPSITDIESLKYAIKTLILQIFAIERGKENNLNQSYGFKSQYSGIETEVLYDEYVRYLVNNAPKPTEEELRSYYNKYKDSKYKEFEKYSVYNLKVKDKNIADSLSIAIEKGSDFFELAKNFSLLNPKNNGKMIPFDKNKNKDIVEALKGVKPGNYSNVFNSRDKKWSIIYFDKMIPEEILSFDKVKNRIKTALNKENQNTFKESTFTSHNDKYNVSINEKFLKIENNIND